jgi:hypothetical protein
MAWEVKRHEGYWLGQQWVRSRFGDQLIVEFATIKCLMFRPYTRKEIFSAEGASSLRPPDQDATGELRRTLLLRYDRNRAQKCRAHQVPCYLCEID